MKTSKKIFSIFIMFLLLAGFVSKSANAQMIDAGTAMSSVVEAVTKLLDKFKTLYGEVRTEYDSLSTAVEGVMNGDLMGAVGNLGLAGAASLEGGSQSSGVVLDGDGDEKEIYDAFYKLFYTYPGKAEDAQKNFCYKKMSEKFLEDNFMEAYIASRAMEVRLESEIKPYILSLEDSLKEEEGKEPNIVEAYKNNYKANKALEDLMIMMQEIAAIKAQLEAAKAVSSKIEPNYQGVGTGLNLGCFDNGDRTQRFAQVGFVSAEVLVYAYSEEEDFADVELTKVKSPLDGKDDEVEQFSKIEAVNTVAEQAINTHNILHKLPEYKKIFDDYHKMQIMHAVALRNLTLSKSCLTAFLQNKDWSEVGEQAVKTYEILKAEYLGASADEGSGQKMKGTENIKMEPSKTDNADIKKYGGDAALKAADNAKYDDPMNNVSDLNESKTVKVSDEDSAKYEDSGRGMELLPWRIGSQAIRNISPIVTVWEDQKNFYDQYIDGKYDNLIKLVKDEFAANYTNKYQGTIKDELKKTAEGMIDGDEITEAAIAALVTPRLDEINLATAAILTAAIKEIKTAKTEIKGLKNVYLPEGKDEIAKIHKNMIDEIKKIKAFAAMNLDGKKIMDLTVNLLLPTVKDTKSEIAYFVGSPAKQADWATPTPAPDTPSIPVREVFHLDETDYANLLGVSVAEFVEYYQNTYGYFPQVWQLMLSKYLTGKSPFTEKEFEVSFKEEPKLWYSGGRYPCVTRGLQHKTLYLADADKVFMADSDTGNYCVNTFADSKNLYDNRVMLDSDKTVATTSLDELLEKLVNSAQSYNINEVNADDKASVGTQAIILTQGCTDEVCSLDKTGELGSLIDISDAGKIVFKPYIKDTFDRLVTKAKEMDSKTEESSEDLPIGNKDFGEVMDEQAPYKTNQFGKFLELNEAESSLRSKVADIEEKLKENQTEIVENLKLIGFEADADFDVIKNFDLIKAKFESARMQQIKNLESNIAKVQKASSVLALKKRLLKFRAVLKALNMDSAAVSNIDYNSVEVDEKNQTFNTENFAATVKSKTVDKEVGDKYAETANAEFAKQLSKLGQPYCLVVW